MQNAIRSDHLDPLVAAMQGRPFRNASPPSATVSRKSSVNYRSSTKLGCVRHSVQYILNVDACVRSGEGF